jgi:hypothetical protein
MPPLAEVLDFSGLRRSYENTSTDWLAFVLGLFTAVFAGIPWYVIVAGDPPAPWWLRLATFWFLGGVVLVLLARHTVLDESARGASLVAEVF